MPPRPGRKPVRLPPRNLAELQLEETLLPADGWVRLSWPGRELYFSRNDEHRFSPEDGRYEVLYLTKDPFTAALETFGSRLYRKSARIPISEWHARVLGSVQLPPLKVADLTFSAMAKARVTLGTLASCSRNVTHKWGRAVMDHPHTYHGLLYLSDYTGQTCLALFKVPGAPPPKLLGTQMFDSHPVSSQLLREYRVTLL